MTPDLSEPMDWKNPEPSVAALLDDLQANILRSHVRKHLGVLFLHFGNSQEGRRLLKELGGRVKSAKTHLDEVETFGTTRTHGTVYVGVGLSASGYAALKISAGVPSDPAFGPDRVIVPDTAATDPAKSFGSYLVFRKLEQNVRRFKGGRTGRRRPARSAREGP